MENKRECTFSSLQRKRGPREKRRKKNDDKDKDNSNQFTLTIDKREMVIISSILSHCLLLLHFQ